MARAFLREYNGDVMKQQFSDAISFLHAVAALREATFQSTDLIWDEAVLTMKLTVTRPENPGQSGSLFFRRKAAYVRTMVTVRHITGYRQSLAGQAGDVYIVDRAEVGRGGHEIAFFFRPGDRSVMDVDHIAGTVEDVGRATAPPRVPVIRNPLLSQEMNANRKPSTSRRIFGRSGKKHP